MTLPHIVKNMESRGLVGNVRHSPLPRHLLKKPMSAPPPKASKLLCGSVLTRMGWTGGAPAPDGTQSAPGACQEKKRRHASHVQRSRSDYYRMDMGKNTLHMIGLNSRGAIVLREKAGLATHYVARRTAVINEIRGFLLERGIIVRQGLRFLRQALPDILAKRTDVLSPRMVRVVADLAGDWRQLDERIEPATDEIETLAKSDDGCRRVMTVPGIGPIISSAMVAAIGNGAAFARGRDFSAWIGLVPKQMSTGDRTILGRAVEQRGWRQMISHLDRMMPLRLGAYGAASHFAGNILVFREN